MLLAIFPGSFAQVPIRETSFALAVSFSLVPRALIKTAINIVHHTIAVQVIVHEITVINTTARVVSLSPTMHP